MSTGGNWTANVTVRVLDTNGDPVAQATVLGRWEFIQDGVPRVEEVSRASLADGTAPFSKTNMNTNGANKIDDVRFVLVDIVGTDPPIDFTLPEPPPSIVLTSGGTVIQP